MYYFYQDGPVHRRTGRSTLCRTPKPADMPNAGGSRRPAFPRIISGRGRWGDLGSRLYHTEHPLPTPPSSMGSADFPAVCAPAPITDTCLEGSFAAVYPNTGRPDKVSVRRRGLFFIPRARAQIQRADRSRLEFDPLSLSRGAIGRNATLRGHRAVRGRVTVDLCGGVSCDDRERPVRTCVASKAGYKEVAGRVQMARSAFTAGAARTGSAAGARGQAGAGGRRRRRDRRLSSRSRTDRAAERPLTTLPTGGTDRMRWTGASSPRRWTCATYEALKAAVDDGGVGPSSADWTCSWPTRDRHPRCHARRDGRATVATTRIDVRPSAGVEVKGSKLLCRTSKRANTSGSVVFDEFGRRTSSSTRASAAMPPPTPASSDCAIRTFAVELGRDSRVGSTKLHPTHVATPLLHNQSTFRTLRPDLENPGTDDMAPICRTSTCADSMGRGRGRQQCSVLPGVRRSRYMTGVATHRCRKLSEVGLTWLGRAKLRCHR